jgi:hypothetical protein
VAQRTFIKGIDSVSSVRAVCRLPAVGGVVQGVGGMGKHLLQQLVDRPHPMTNQLMYRRRLRLEPRHVLSHRTVLNLKK